MNVDGMCDWFESWRAVRPRAMFSARAMLAGGAMLATGAMFAARATLGAGAILAGSFTPAAGAMLAPEATLAGAAGAVPAAAVAAGPSAPDAADSFNVGGATIHVELQPTAFHVGAGALLAWVRRSAEIVTGYYGQFPTRSVLVRVQAVDGERVGGGQTFGSHGGFIRIRVGNDVTDAQLLNDWVLVHEMTHLALPDTGEVHAWLSEGLATYVERIARVQAGNRSELDVWTEEIHSMPRGIPQPGDRGLDQTHTWGRTYWGGAMFCLLADVQIHTRTHNRFGLQDALRAIVRASGGLVADWPIEKVLRTGDAAVGVNVLEDLYAQWKDAPVAPDLMDLWRKLGVEPDGSSVRLRDDAPLADVRKAIMRSRAQSVTRSAGQAERRV